jgi:hypothetical protein
LATIQNSSAAAEVTVVTLGPFIKSGAAGFIVERRTVVADGFLIHAL